MKFSTVAASAVLFGMVLALPQPQEVVYETEVVTITSCAPTVTDCPYATATPEPEYPEVEEPEHLAEEPEHLAEETPCTTTAVEVPEITHTPTYPNTTIPEYPEEESPEYPEHPEYPEYPEEESPEYPEHPEEPEVPEYPEVPHYEPSGTGSIPYPVNTSTPEVPSTPPPQEGAASKVGAPLAVVIGAAALAFFA
jgi:hypothetical protein